MKQFFKKCLEELDLKTGIKQLHWLKQECKDQAEYDTKIDLLIGSMVRVTDRFDYIPEDMQKTYILLEMEQDQQYDSLNSRTIWKWLDRHKSKHMTHSQFTEVDLSQGKYFDELNPETQKLVNDFLVGLSESLQAPQFKDIQSDMKQIANEDKRHSERPKPSGYVPDPNLETMANNRAEYGRQCTDLHKGTILPGMPSFEEWVAMQKVN